MTIKIALMYVAQERGTGGTLLDRMTFDIIRGLKKPEFQTSDVSPTAQAHPSVIPILTCKGSFPAGAMLCFTPRSINKFDIVIDPWAEGAVRYLVLNADYANSPEGRIRERLALQISNALSHHLRCARHEALNGISPESPFPIVARRQEPIQTYDGELRAMNGW